MRQFMKVSTAVAFALGLIGLHAAEAADVPYPQGQNEAPPQAYGPPPAESYAPPPAVAYGYPPPAPYYVYPPPPRYVVVPGPYFRPYWRGYPVHYAYGYGRWGHGYRHW